MWTCSKDGTQLVVWRSELTATGGIVIRAGSHSWGIVVPVAPCEPGQRAWIPLAVVSDGCRLISLCGWRRTILPACFIQCNTWESLFWTQCKYYTMKSARWKAVWESVTLRDGGRLFQLRPVRRLKMNVSQTVFLCDELRRVSVVDHVKSRQCKM